MDIVTTCERPDLKAEADAAFRVEWPEFLFPHDPLMIQYEAEVAKIFPQYDVLMLDEDRVVAGGWGVAIRWDGAAEDLPAGYDATMVRAVEGHKAGIEATTLSYMTVAVVKDMTRRGLAGEVLTALRGRAVEAGLSHVIAPVRPTLKPRYPLTAMESYATWTGPDGLSIDPWIRTHQRMGATVLGPAPRSMVVTGTIADWESWTDMVFPETGRYVVPGALGLVDIDRAEDTGTYTEENLWVQHL
jgi:GNAT superfamily N-acetyltransferase